MDIHKIVEATLGITEEEMVAASEPMVEEPMAVEEPAVAERPQITPELIAQLTEQLPELAEVDVEMLMKGMTVEMEHFETVGGDVSIIARITCDHIKEHPGADYYAALEQMEAQLKEVPAEEEVPADGDAVMEPGDHATQKPTASPFEAVKESEEPKEEREVEGKKAANKAAEDKINQEEIDK